MKQIYLIRHAESEAGAKGIMAGSDLDSPLSDKGRQQAKEAGQYLKDKGIELMMVSPMSRTRETAKIIADEIGLSASKLIESELVMERDFGRYSGAPYADYLKERKKGILDQSQLEPLPKLEARVRKAFEWLAARPEQVILVSSHGSTGRMFKIIDQELAHDDFHSLKSFQNCEIYEFTI